MEYLSHAKFVNYTPPNDLYDGHTVAWYDYTDLSTLTLTDSSVSQWNDKLGSGHNLVQPTGAYQPKWTGEGILFDGIDNYMKTASLNLTQPETVYIIFKQLSWTYWDIIFDGSTSGSGMLRQMHTSPKLCAGTTPAVET